MSSEYGLGNFSRNTTTKQRMMLIFGVIMIALSPFFPLIFNTTESIRRLATWLIVINGVLMPFYSFTHASYFTIRSGGKTFITMLFDSGFVWALSVPFAFALSYFTTWPVVWMVAAVQALEEIALMDAVICIISELFISGHNMMAEYIMPELLSKENNILPLLMEKCVEKDFENKYGHIHYERWTGNTEQKKEKISKFLGTVKQKKSKQSYAFDMISESMINCFSQSFFISYRKIDGKYIDILRNKIHDDISLVDTQLWYDAYLMAGENYDASLRNVMDNCNAIILVVTPNLLLDSNNYVERVEVPYARKNGIPIMQTT